jgi:hypothetical protein
MSNPVTPNSNDADLRSAQESSVKPPVGNVTSVKPPQALSDLSVKPPVENVLSVKPPQADGEFSVKPPAGL